MSRPIHLEIGDTIEVGGQHFVLVSATQSRNAPSTVEFRQPIELIRIEGQR